MAAIAPARRPLVRALQLLPDRRLSRLAAEGDAHAFAAIYERHHRALYRYCLSILHDPDDAGDALQSAMVSALSALTSGVQVLALKPWLFRIAHNESISLARRHGSESSVADVPERAAADQDPATRERLRQLVADLTGLPERQRGALVMRELSGLGYEEIGGALNCSGPAARQAVFEARTALHEIAAGRDMDCLDVRELISSADGRLLRGRRVRAHLGDCGACRDFQGALATRRGDLALLFPPPAAITAALALKAALGGATGGGVLAALGGGGGGLAAALTGAGIGGQAAAKALAIVAVAAGAGAGALELAAEEAQRPQRERAQTAQVPESEISRAARGQEATGEAGRTDAARSRDRSDRERRRDADRRAAGDPDVRAERRRERKAEEEREGAPELDAQLPERDPAPVPVPAPPAAPSPPSVPVSSPGGGSRPGYSSDSVSLLPDRIEVNHGDNHVSVGPNGVDVSGAGGSVSVGPNGVSITIGGQTLTLGAPGTR